MTNYFNKFLNNYILTSIIAIVGGKLFIILYIPVPWLSGPLLAVTLFKNFLKREFTWKVQFRNFGLLIIGYTIGLSLTKSTFKNIIAQLPFMFFLTFILLSLSIIIALLISRLFKIDYNTSLLASLPGGLSQVIVIAEETKKVNLEIVTVSQSIRLILIVIITPLIVKLSVSPSTNILKQDSPIDTENIKIFPSIFIFLATSFIFIIILKKIKAPTPYLLGPIIGTTILQLLGIKGPELSYIIENGAQTLIGIHIGLMLNLSKITNKKKILLSSFSSAMLLLISSTMLSLLLIFLQPINQSTSLLSLAPGGIDQMGIISREVNANLAIVSSYQIFRLLSIFLIIPFIAKFLDE